MIIIPLIKEGLKYSELMNMDIPELLQVSSCISKYNEYENAKMAFDMEIEDLKQGKGLPTLHDSNGNVITHTVVNIEQKIERLIEPFEEKLNEKHSN